MKFLVIIAEGLHLGYLGCYGNEWVATPNLDRLAAEGVVFDQHFADHPSLEGACRAWRTGCYRFPSPDSPSQQPGADGVDPVRRLTEAAATTALVTDAERPLPAAFTLGWREVFALDRHAPLESPRLEALLERAGDALDGLAADERWLLWLDLPTLLPPWETTREDYDLYFNPEVEEDEPEGEGEEEPALTPWGGPLPERLDPADDATFLRLQRSYAAAVTYLDAGLGLLLDDLQERGLLDEVTVLVTSGFGQNLGEHGVVAAEVPWLHEELVHLPLMVRLPGREQAGRRVTGLTQPVDLAPTLLAGFGLSAAPAHGASLWPLIRGQAEAVRAYACSGLKRCESIEWAVRTPHWALLLQVAPGAEPAPRPARLYAKPDDRWEVNDVYQHHPELTQHLEEILRGFVDATPNPGPVNAPPLRDIRSEPPESGEVDGAPAST